ncbi:hypothetical protein P6F26_16170 [Roseibacterium sp. SDUM158017]|uniref:hypothetical protein n=1 Tax=Roseicyclus salinarum TaxID=3036773 RepID=UPI0024151152|nr:hypothetical protein [Roseibacterium sp. SDUM158017]MDG4649983.1 hypothetical protein [Roseibacterium sp. SDUM158017]
MDDPVSITALLVLGLGFKMIGFAVRDELLLRILVMTGLACDALFYGLRADPVIPSVLTNTLLICVNTALVLLIATERTTWRMSRDDRALYAHFPTLTPGQFRRLRPLMRHETAAAGAALALEGEPVADLMLVFSDRIEITKQDETFPIAGPTFVGEVALLTGNPSSAGVVLPAGGAVVRLPIAALRARMARAPALSNAMVALFGQELARKVADSVPMGRAALPRGAAGARLPASVR